VPTRTAAVLDVEFGQPPVVDDVELPDPGPMHVIVQQFASGICHSQLNRRRNPTVSRPACLGHESTGVVVAKGKDVTYVKEGDHVLIGFLPRNAEPGMLPHQTPRIKFRGHEVAAPFNAYTWMSTVIADERWLVKMSNDIATDVTSVIGCAVQTGVGAVLNTARVGAGDSAAIYGVGGLGSCAVQACANAAANPIIAVDVANDKLQYARTFGATHTINATDEDPIARINEITNGGADFVFDMVGSARTLSQLLPSVRPGVYGYNEGGTGVIIGIPNGETMVPVRDVFDGAKKLVGCLAGTGHPERDYPLYLEWFSEGKLPLDRLVTERYTMETINEACAALEQGRILGRAIVEF
jgi:Zn-dependent alcohol dehydrogenase